MFYSKVVSWFGKYWLETIILLIFATIFSGLSLVNHYNFRTNALDLGMFNHALYSFAHGKMNYFTLDLHGEFPVYFADHFSPLTMLYSPLYYFFGSWTLLLVQIVSVLLGALGCYKVCKLKLADNGLKYLVLIIFLAQWSIMSALAFDFHNNVVAAMMVPWLYYYYIKERRTAFLILFLLILIAKENMSLWLTFILIGFILQKGWQEIKNNWKNYFRFEVPLIVFSAVYFYIVVFKLMPFLYDDASRDMVSRIGYHGKTAGGLLSSMFNNPVETFRLFFVSDSTDPMSIGIKEELHWVVLLSGGIALVLRPAYLVMLIPIYVQKMLNGNSAYWGISSHYSIEFAPIIVLALIDLIRILKKPIFQYAVLSLVVVSTVWINYDKLKSRKTAWYDRTFNDFTYGPHYESGGIDVEFIRSELAKIPDEIPLSVSSNLAPHLANRDRLYHFPIINDAQMLVLFKEYRSSYPMSRENFSEMIKELIESGQFEMTVDSGDLLVLKRRN